MMFLEEADFRKQIRDDTLERIIGDDASILYDAERATLAEMESYLRVRFDVAQIWNKIGTARNALIVMYAVDILLYHIHSRIAPQQIPALRGIRQHPVRQMQKRYVLLVHAGPQSCAVDKLTADV